MKRRYIQLKECSIWKKGAIFEERCDEGNQPFACINNKTHKKFSSESVRNYDVVTENPEWYQELVPFYVPKNKVAQIKKILKIN